MKASIKLIKSQQRKGDTVPIYVELAHKNSRKRQKIGNTKLEDWDHINNTPLNTHEDYFKLLPIVLDFNAKITKVNFGNYNFNQAVNVLFENAREDLEHKSAMICTFFDTYINEKKAKKRPYQSFVDVKSVLVDYLNYLGKNDLPINDITYEWLNSFIIYKLENGCGEGGVMSYLRTLRSVVFEAQRRTSLQVDRVNHFKGIIKTTTPKPVIEISKEDFKKLLDFKPKISTTKRNKFNVNRNIQIVLFQFYIGGHDYIDIALLKWTDIKGARVKFKRYKNRFKKNGGQEVNNMLNNEALHIINTFGNRDTERIFSFIPCPISNNKKYIEYRRNVNHSLQRISEQLKIPILKTKSTRYLFRTYAGELLVHDLIVMKLQGHQPEGITYKYQGTISNDKLDFYHKEIIAL